jgi:hypothetical protein
MNNYNEFYSAIDDIKTSLSRDLIGAITENEIIESTDPLSCYVMGVLWSKRIDRSTESSQEDDIEELSLESATADEMENPLESDDGIANANSYKPSAMGVSVMLPASADILNIMFSFGKYVYSEKYEIIKPDENSDEEKEIKIIQYARTPCNLEISVKIPNICKSVNCPKPDEIKDIGADITLTVRKIMSDGSRLVTVSVVNTVEAPQRKQELNEAALFQCELTLKNPIGFIPVYQNVINGQSDEEQITSMLYRDVYNYAYGHGCSVRYKEDGQNKVTIIHSDFIPCEMVYQMMPGAITKTDILHLKYWTDADRSSACDNLMRFVDEYIKWREHQEETAKTLSGYKNLAEITIERINTCINRLRNGIAELRKNDIAWESFRLMNESMLLQRMKTKNLSELQSDSVTWFPFQLAYILQVIPDIVNLNSDFRDSVDLLWFPTGGGKTEAYLGVASFTIFFRRLSTRPNNDGVTVIMRYTLRLLTIQQFERAAALICACEYLRRKYNITGGEINIGLWIGSSMTPNRIDGEGGAASILEKLRQNPGESINEGNPVQITNCPWCRETIDLDGYRIIDNQLIINCNNNPKCDFHGSLPIYVVDDDVYVNKPTLLLSTIDKFARIAWELKSKALFGENCASPDLIIQDELHLISGPLGSLAGIYEIAVEYLSANNNSYPKVIASTATVKNANEQIRNLYNKEMIQFPPNGMNFDDSFFAVRAGTTERPARTYIGLCEAGGSLADLMLRVYSNLIFTKALFIKQERSNDVIDQFSTIIGYFNALKDLGATDNIIRDRIRSNIRTLVERKFKSESEAVGLNLGDVRYGIQDELTSRKSSKEIKETLGKLEISYPDTSHYSIVLASNMLSVGIDINRLGLMTVYSQPKSNAEYIQATSRVGRQNPGLVITMFNTARSRDKSHYEQFNYYHKAFYQYVEATSVTPYSARALEKALHCAFVAMLRFTVDNLGANDFAVNFRSNDESVKIIIDFIISRIKTVHPDSVEVATEYLAKISQEWERLAKENPSTLVYVDYSGTKISLLQSAEQASILGFPLTLNSLRNVEQSSNVFIEER